MGCAGPSSWPERRRWPSGEHSAAAINPRHSSGKTLSRAAGTGKWRRSASIAATVLPYMVLSVFSAIQRSHDMDWSGWTVLLSLIPLFGLIWLSMPGTPGRNRFGAPPPPNTTGVKVGAALIPVLFVLLVLATTVRHP
ncbi:DUF805 domain-containing protein [Hyalangium sp.]|uniref:DUF805 domain-containing protein n=1 Tax=Hyalangium sp. TaxID=2028555 RepID=UPI0039C8A6C9